MEKEAKQAMRQGGESEMLPIMDNTIITVDVEPPKRSLESSAFGSECQPTAGGGRAFLGAILQYGSANTSR